MRWHHYLILLALLVAVVAAMTEWHRGRVILLKRPPPELAKWYKPQNKRQVWLHTMFNLRREMQAIREYAERGDAQRMADWTARFVRHYRQIGEMVPEWASKLDAGGLARLEKAVRAQDTGAVPVLLDALGESCRACHADYQTVTAILYRAPDFSAITVPPAEVPYREHMVVLGRELNRVKIAITDGDSVGAGDALTRLRQGMDRLGQTCGQCHRPAAPPYPGPAMTRTLDAMARAITEGDPKQSGRTLGTLAVQACARCHGTHRLAFAARRLFDAPPGWRQLLRH